MSIYSYKESKVIDEIIVKRTANGAVRAYLHASAEAGIDTIRSVLAALKKNDFECIPFTLDGKPSIEVRGFKRDSQIVMLLEKNKWITEKPEVTLDEGDNLGWIDKFRKRSLQTAGGLYAVGDVGFFTYGLLDASPLDAMAGILYGLPSPVLLAYGRNDQSQLQIKDFAKIMAKEFKKEVATLPEGCSLQSLTADHKKGLIESASDLLQRYPSEFMNLCYAGAGACILGAAGIHLNKLATKGVAAETVAGWMTHLKTTQPSITKEVAAAAALKNVKLENILNAGVGLSTITAGLFGTLVKEKARDEDEPQKAGIAGWWDWMRERPLTIAGGGLMVSTMLHAAATVVATKGQDPKHKKAVPFRVLFVITNLMAELMVAISSKGHGEGVVSDKSVDNSAIAIAADLIIKQPKALQNTLIQEMGKFLGRPDVLALKDDEAIDTLRRQVESLRNNPWVEAESVPEKTVAVNTILSPAKPAMPAWQAKAMASEAASPHLHTSA